MDIEKLLEELCRIDGTSGDEGAVREYITEKIKGKCEFSVDPLGNIIAFRKGKTTPKNKVMVSAHMDEVGMIVTSVKSDGTFTVSSVGGVDAEAVIGRRVTVNGMLGVIGSKAYHNLSSDERNKPAEFSSLYADIGAESREEAEKLVSPGDRVCFDREYFSFGEGLVCGKAIDDRFGCAAMICMINSELQYDCYFTFVVQEEVGLRGSRTAAYTVDPDFAIVLEATTAADIPLASGEKKCCFLGKGSVVSYMDHSTIYDRELYELSKTSAAENNIPWQTKMMVAGGNDSGAIHLTRGGVRTMAISIPCRYLHSPSCTAKLSDIKASLELARIMTEKACML